MWRTGSLPGFGSKFLRNMAVQVRAFGFDSVFWICKNGVAMKDDIIVVNSELLALRLIKAGRSRVSSGQRCLLY